MGKWTEVTKTLPRREGKSDETPRFREKVDLAKQNADRAALKEEYRKVRADLDALDEKKAPLDVRRQALEELLADSYRNEGRDRPFYFEDGARIEVSDQPSFSVADPEKLIAWVRENHLERLLTLHSSRVTELGKAELEAGRVESIKVEDPITGEAIRPRCVLMGGAVEASAYSQVKLVVPKPKGK